MKKVIIVFILLIIFLFSSCVDTNIQLPEGVWVSEEPNIVLFMDQLYIRRGHNFIPDSERGNFLGIYTVDDEEIKVIVSFHISRQRFQIQPITVIDPQTNIISGDGSLFSGAQRLVGNRMYYTLTPAFQERTGFTEIIFYRVEDPESVHPLNWTIPPR